jgi:hypothetical protein
MTRSAAEPRGARDDAEIREFVVGTGGRDSTGFGTVASNSEIQERDQQRARRSD